MTSTDEPMFGYMGKQHIKVYRPCSQMRFLYAGDFGDNYCFGLEQLPAKGDLLFITGGEKDVMSLAAHGFHAICFNSETAFIPAAVIHRLSFRFKHIILLYDVDSIGLKSSAKREEELKEYGVKRLLLPLAGTKTEKDVSDYFMLGNSREDLIKLFLDYLETLYSETMSALKSCEVDFNNPPPIAQMIVSVNDVPLGTQGNLLCITGGEGTGKSNYVAALIAGAIRPTGTDVDALGVTLHENGRNKAVLFYDTEQSEVQLYKNISNLLRRCGREAMPEWFKAYCLTGMSRKERLLSIIQSLDKYHYQYGGVHLVVIDGIADLIKCANDESGEHSRRGRTVPAGRYLQDVYRYGTALYSQRAEAEGTLGKRVAAEGCGDPFHRERQRSDHISGEGSESKGWKSAGRAYHAVFVG